MHYRIIHDIIVHVLKGSVRTPSALFDNELTGSVRYNIIKLIPVCFLSVCFVSVITYLYTFIKRDGMKRVWRYVFVVRRQTENTMGKRKRTQRQTTIYKNIHIKVKIEQDEPHHKPGVNLGALEE